MSSEKFRLSTIDNPFNPFKSFDEWNEFDESKGYFSNSLLARIAISSDELSEADQLLIIEDAIDEIIKENASGIHVKVYPDQEIIPRIL